MSNLHAHNYYINLLNKLVEIAPSIESYNHFANFVESAYNEDGEPEPNPPYEFTLTIKCNEKRSPAGLEILTFSTDNPYDIVKHTCKHCGDIHTFSAVETFKIKEYSEQSLINHKDYYYGKPVMHDFKVIAPCEKLLDADII